MNHITKRGLDKIESSPLDFWWHFINPNPPGIDDKTAKKIHFDTALRCAILTPDVFNKTYVKMPTVNTRTNIGKAELENLNETVRNNQQILLLPSDHEAIMEMRKSVLKNPACIEIFKIGTAENHIDFTEENTGVKIKFKSHWFDEKNKIIVHVSSCTDASESQFSKDAFNFKNHKRVAIYMDGYSGEANGFIFVNIENKAPYKLSVLTLDDRSVELGRETYIKNCHTYKQCVKSGVWPGLKPTIEPVSLPEWAFKN